MKVFFLVLSATGGLLQVAFGNPKSPPREKVHERPIVEWKEAFRAQMIFAPKPEYPHFFRWAGTPQGQGLFDVQIRADGIVSNVTIFRSTGHPVLDSEAVRTLRHWKFPPDKWTRMRITINFTLGNYGSHSPPYTGPWGREGR